MTNAVLFDMDGVVVYSARAHFEAWRDVAERLGGSLDFERFKPTLGTDNPGTIRALFGPDFRPDEIESITEAKEAAFRDAIARDFVPVDGVTDLVAALHREGWRMALATSAPPENAAHIMSMLPGGEHIAVRVDRSMVEKAKPEPDIFLTAADLLGVEPGRCIVIEDSIAGLTAARRAGMATLGLATSMRRDELEPVSDAVRDTLVGVTPAFLGSLIDRIAVRAS